MYYPVVDLSLNIQAYRVRFVETELPKDKRILISEFGYNPNTKNIKMMRLNLAGEQVLYTSTNPLVSYNETISSENMDNPFYLSVWKKNNVNHLCNCFLSSFDSCSDNPQSNAYKVKKEYCKKLNSNQKLVTKEIGKVLEKNYPEDSKDKYVESAHLASDIFKYADCIIMPSAKNNEEINLTFNKDYADNSLVLDRVYLCNPFPIPNMRNSLVFLVIKIGLVSGDKVVWYNWKVKNNLLIDPKSNQMFQYKNNANYLIYPNIVNPIDGWHYGHYNDSIVKFQIEIEEDND